MTGLLTQRVTGQVDLAAMGSHGSVVVVAPEAHLEHLLAYACERIDQLERRWSRFLPDSEVSRLNAAAGRPVLVGDDTRLLLEASRLGWAATEGRWDPTVHDAVVCAGYDRPFDRMRRAGAPDARQGSGDEPPRGLGLADLELQPAAGGAWARLPNGARFDPGGIGKGLAADLVVAELLGRGALGASVDLGGDVVVAGAPADDDDRWWIAVDAPGPGGPTRVGTVGLVAGALATSTPRLRRWMGGDGPTHHLLDPRSGRAATIPTLRSVTVATTNGWLAEVTATAACVEAGRDLDGPRGWAADRANDPRALVVALDPVPGDPQPLGTDPFAAGSAPVIVVTPSMAPILQSPGRMS